MEESFEELLDEYMDEDEILEKIKLDEEESVKHLNNHNDTLFK